MRTILAIAMIIGVSALANAHPSQPNVHAFRAMVDRQQSVPTRVFDGTGYDGRETISGGPVGGLPNRN